MRITRENARSMLHVKMRTRYARLAVSREVNDRAIPAFDVLDCGIYFIRYCPMVLNQKTTGFDTEGESWAVNIDRRFRKRSADTYRNIGRAGRHFRYPIFNHPRSSGFSEF